MPAPGYYYLSSDQTPVGPHAASALIALRLQGTINAETLISRPGEPAWRPLAEWPELGEKASDGFLPDVGSAPAEGT